MNHHFIKQFILCRNGKCTTNISIILKLLMFTVGSNAGAAYGGRQPQINLNTNVSIPCL